MFFRCPNCQRGIDIAESIPQDSEIEEITCPTCNSRFSFSDAPTVSTEHSPLRIGHFETRDILGEGGFGIVYRAWDAQLERWVALKVPRPGKAHKNSRKNTLREARAAASIKHPNVVQVHEIGSTDDQFYIVSELIDGISLSQWIRSQTPSAQKIAEVMYKVAEGVEAAHVENVIHRDLKPSNILMDGDDEPHITDFGLAKRKVSEKITVTNEGVVIGTPAYMSPEQAKGATGDISTATDVYSLGVILYELLTNQRPFAATDSATMIFQIINREPKRPRELSKEIPKDLETICLKAMEKQASSRYASAKEFAEDLCCFIEGRPIKARPITALNRSWRWIKRNPAISIAVSSTVLLAVAILVISFMKPKSVEVSVPEPPFTLSTTIRCDLPQGLSQVSHRANWRIQRLDERRIPIPEETIEISNEEFEILERLKPGEYLFTVGVDDIGFQQVYRTIPQNTDLKPGSYNPIKFEILDDGTVKLPSIQLFRQQDILADMARVEGGEYQPGTGIGFTRNSAKATFALADYYVSRTEVTYDDYIRILPEPLVYSSENPPPKGKHPVVGVNWFQAAHFAEKTGRRLLTEVEWEYAATNRGTTETPWVGEFNPSPRFELKPVGTPDRDVTPETGIRGLFTNGSEICSSTVGPYEGGEMPQMIYEKMKRGYAYRGGPFEIVEGHDYSDWKLKARTAMNDRLDSGPYLSMRCGKSASFSN